MNEIISGNLIIRRIVQGSCYGKRDKEKQRTQMTYDTHDKYMKNI